MAVIDGKYEVLSQRVLEPDQTLLSVTAPDGGTLTIVWFDLATPEAEAEFERYRQLLRTLKRKNLAAVHDIVSRPGAHYVAWYPAEALPPAAAGEEVRSALKSYNYAVEQADLRMTPDGEKVYALAFGETELPPDPAPPPPQKRDTRTLLERLPRWALRWGLGGLLGLLGVILLSLSFQLSINDRLVTLPDLRGENVNAAAQRLYEQGLEVALTPDASEQEAFSVLESDPAAGDTLRPGQSVRLSYALPPNQVALVEVPQVRGSTFSSEIQTRLEEAGLRLGNVAYIHTNVAEGVILAQSKEENSQANEGTPVHLLVSEGPSAEQTFVLDLVGRPLEEATVLARLAGITLSEPDRRPDTLSPPGTVLDQSIPPLTPVDQREAVLRLTVAGETAAEDSTVPSLIGMSRAEAERVAQEAGYTLTFEELSNENESSNLPTGVIDQTPAPGRESADGELSALLNIRPVAVPRPAVSVGRYEFNPRDIPYTFRVERGIPDITARITATTLTGRTFDVVRERTVSGGDRISGSWLTRAPGPVTFQLYLGSDTAPYDELTVNP